MGKSERAKHFPTLQFDLFFLLMMMNIGNHCDSLNVLTQRTTYATPMAWYQSTSLRTWAEPFSNTCSTSTHLTFEQHGRVKCYALVMPQYIASFLTGYQSSRAQRRQSHPQRWVRWLNTFTSSFFCMLPKPRWMFFCSASPHSNVASRILHHTITLSHCLLGLSFFYSSAVCGHQS